MARDEADAEGDAMTDNRPTLTSIVLHAHRLATGETVEAAHLEYATGQIVGPGWLGVRIAGGEWLPVQARDQLRLVLDLRLCRTVEEVRALIVEGAEVRGKR